MNTIGLKLMRFLGRFSTARPTDAAEQAPAIERLVGGLPPSAFDNLTRSVGSQDSRRMALKVSILGLFGMLGGGLGFPRSAQAAADCLCGRQLYDSSIQCCTPTGIQTKHPIANLDACPNKVPHPGATCVPNGCGAADGASFPGSFGAASVVGCCDNHDCCYGKCNEVKVGCDDSFEVCMTESCNSAYPPDFVTVLGVRYDRNRIRRDSCRGAANAYWAAVRTRGGAAYTAAQQASCDCCANRPCSTCPGGTCSSLPSCQDPGCVCFQTIEGRGFCHLPQSCAGLSTCSSSANCPSGWACVSVTCCGGTAICIRPCFVIAGLTRQAAPELSGMTTAGPADELPKR